MKKLFLAIIVLATSSNIVNAQNIWLKDTASAVSFEFTKPIFDENFTPFTSANFLSWKQRLNDRFTLSFLIPFAYAKVDESGIDGEFTFGNLFIGTEIYFKKSLWLETGIHIPTTPEDNFGTAFVAIAADLLRIESFSPNSIVLPIILNFSQGKDNFYYRFRMGPKIIVNTSSNSLYADDAEMFLDYGMKLGYGTKKFGTDIGLTGSYLVTEDVDFSDASIHQTGIGFYASFGRFVPALSLRLPIDKDWSDWIDFAFGIGLTYNLK